MTGDTSDDFWRKQWLWHNQYLFCRYRDPSFGVLTHRGPGNHGKSLDLFSKRQNANIVPFRVPRLLAMILTKTPSGNEWFLNGKHHRRVKRGDRTFTRFGSGGYARRTFHQSIL